MANNSLTDDDTATAGYFHRPTWRTLVGTLLVLFSLVGVILGVIVQQEGNNRMRCTEDWANAFSDRADTVTKLSTARGNALDVLVRTLPVGVMQPSPGELAKLRQQFQVALKRYHDASDAYTRALQGHPLPPPPKLRC